MDEWVKQIGRNVKEQREHLKLTQEKLAERVEVDTSYLGQIERGRREPSLKLLWKLSVGLNMSLSQLLRDEMVPTEQRIAEELAFLFEELTVRNRERLLEMARLVRDIQEER